MFTVKWGTIHNQELVFQAATVIASPIYGDWKKEPDNGTEIIALEFYDINHNKAHEPIRYGRVYVMNDNGKTVANYNLGGWHYTKK